MTKIRFLAVSATIAASALLPAIIEANGRWG
jgi:hypothetical protein